MVAIPAKMRVGKKLEGDSDVVQKQLEDIYADVAPAVNRKPDIVIQDRDPTNSDVDFDFGTFWLNTSSGNKWILTADTPTWTAF